MNISLDSRFLTTIAALFISTVTFSGAKATTECSGPTHCQQICAQRQDELNADTHPRQIYVCQLNESTGVTVVEGEDAEDDEIQTSGSMNHTSYICTCVSYMQVDDPDGGGAGGSRPGKDNPPYFPPPPTDGYYVPDTPLNQCLDKAEAKHKACMEERKKADELASTVFERDEATIKRIQRDYDLGVDLCEDQMREEKTRCYRQYRYQKPGVWVDLIGKSRHR